MKSEMYSKVPPPLRTTHWY